MEENGYVDYKKFAKLKGYASSSIRSYICNKNTGKRIQRFDEGDIIKFGNRWYVKKDCDMADIEIKRHYGYNLWYRECEAYKRHVANHLWEFARDNGGQKKAADVLGISRQRFSKWLLDINDAPIVPPTFLKFFPEEANAICDILGGFENESNENLNLKEVTK